MRDHAEAVSYNFIDLITKHLNYLSNIRGCSVMIQKHGMTIAQSQSALDTLSNEIRDQKELPGEKSEHCNLDTKRIQIDNGLTTNVAFFSGVIKIQNGLSFEAEMTYQEKRACKDLLLDDLEADEEGDVSKLSFQQRAEMDQKRKITEISGMSKYIDCGFIKGSAAIVESLWSEEDCLLGNKRRHGMSPVTNECILFLKKNKDLWSITDVNQANENRKANNRDARLQKKMAIDAEFRAEMDDLN